MDKTFHFTVNGQARTVTTDPERPLLEVLRADLQLTGPKRGCGAGKCRPPLERFWASIVHDVKGRS